MSKLIPFRWLPGSWGLKGKAYERAEAEYLYEGETLERHLIDIDYPIDDPALASERAVKLATLNFAYGHCDEFERDERCLKATIDDEKVLRQALLNLSHAHGKLTDYEHERAMVEFNYEDEIDQKIALYEIDVQYGHVTPQIGEKEIATLKGESWVGGDGNYEGDGKMRFDFEWNEQWIEELRQNGYEGATDEIVMKKWFAAICFQEIMSSNPDGVEPWVYDMALNSFQRGQGE